MEEHSGERDERRQHEQSAGPGCDLVPPPMIPPTIARLDRRREALVLVPRLHHGTTLAPGREETLEIPRCSNESLMWPWSAPGRRFTVDAMVCSHGFVVDVEMRDGLELLNPSLSGELFKTITS